MLQKNLSKLGRPTKMTPAVLGKLREAFLFGATDVEACLLADIHPDTLYAFQKENKEFSEEKRRLKMNPVLKARQTIFKDLDNPHTARWYLERRLKNEFGSAVIDDEEKLPHKVTVTIVEGRKPREYVR